MSVPITVPMRTMNMASVNFAFSLPTTPLPASQRTGAIMIVFTMMCMRSAFKSTFRLNVRFGSTSKLDTSFFWLNVCHCS